MNLPRCFSRPLISLTVSLAMTITPIHAASAVDVWLGTNTPNPKSGSSLERSQRSRGIYHASLDPDTGRLGGVELVAQVRNPGFLTLHPELDVLYSIGARNGVEGVFAFSIQGEPDSRSLADLNDQPIGHGGAAHLATDRTGRVLLTAQYDTGSVAVFPIRDDGSLSPRSDLQQHSGGSGVVADRQSEPHAHWIGTSPDNRFVFVPDLGLDRVVIYALDVTAGKLTPHGEGVCPPGSGPRHMKFSPDGKTIYVLNELSLTVTVFAYDAKDGVMTPVQTIATLSEQTKSQQRHNSCSEIVVHPTGKFVYAANRGHDSVTVFAADEDAKLTEIQNEPVRGALPRNINLDPTGRWLIAAGAESHTAAVFEIDADTGRLTYTRNTAMVPSPICVLFGPSQNR